MVILRNTATGETLELTLWRDGETRRKSGQKGELLEWKLQSLAAIAGQMPTVENFIKGWCWTGLVLASNALDPDAPLRQEVTPQ